MGDPEVYEHCAQHSIGIGDFWSEAKRCSYESKTGAQYVPKARNIAYSNMKVNANIIKT